MSNEVSPDQMQARIQQARREAENLKDRIKRKKDELADGTRELPTFFEDSSQLPEFAMRNGRRRMLMVLSSLWYRQKSTRSPSTKPNDEDEKDTQRPSREDICHALVYR